VRIFQCRHCGRYFRDSCFSVDYWKHRAGRLPKIYKGLMYGQARRQVARTLEISRGVVDRAERQLGKHCLLEHLRYLRRLEGRIAEPVVLDGLRTYATSQFEPLDLNTMSCCESGFMLHVAAAPLRRSGSMTDRQKQIREQRERELGLPEPGVRRRVTRQALLLLEKLRRPGCILEFRTDLEPDYSRALADLAGKVRVVHRRVSSKAPRDTDNPLWRINLQHLVMRHSLKSHSRETIAFHKRLRGLMDRALALQVWINCIKGLSERNERKARLTPAMQLGLESKRRSARQVLARRLFPEREGLPEALREIYEGRLKARPREQLAVRIPVFAY
jgi:hypothetical protein